MSSGFPLCSIPPVGGSEKSYSIHTIDRLRRQLAPEDRLFFIIGADAFAEIESWYRWQDVVKAVEFIVVTRPGHDYRVPPGATVIGSIPWPCPFPRQKCEPNWRQEFRLRNWNRR